MRTIIRGILSILITTLIAIVAFAALDRNAIRVYLWVLSVLPSADYGGSAAVGKWTWSNGFWQEAVAFAVVYVFPLVAVGVSIFGLWTWRYRTAHPETRCRKCAYMLKSLSEPKCPECGEVI